MQSITESRSRSGPLYRNKLVHLSAAFLFAGVSAMANAQETVFEEDFTSGAGQFSAQGSVYSTDGNVRMRGGSSAGSVFSSTIDASGYSNLTLSFDRITTGLDSGEAGQALLSINGGNFTAIESVQNASGRTTINLGAAADDATIQIGFRVVASSFFEVYQVDNIVVEGESGTPPTGDELNVSGFFLETGGTATTPDEFSFTNTGDAAISSLVIDLTAGSGAPVFDPADVPFATTGSANVGFAGNFALSSGNQVLTLSFSDFDPGETFTFNADLDDANGAYTTGAEVAGSSITVSASGSDSAQGQFAAAGGDANRAVVNTDSTGPEPGNCSAIGPDPTVSSLEADDGPFGYDTINVSSSVSGFGGGTIHYPVNTNSDCAFGLIAVVPGFISPESSIRWWGPRLSTHGFVVITIETNSGFDSPESRADQLRAALDYAIDQSNSSSSALSGLVDVTKQGVMGWSMGGGGALISAAEDPTLKAAVPQAPYETGSNDFDEIVTPTLILACENDGTAPVSSHASPFYNRIPSSTEKAFLEINNGSHSCANSGNSNEDLLGKYGVAWMKRFMDDDTRYSPFLCGAFHQDDLSGSTISEYRENCPY